jgi:bifunctional non-homologous end joining protein LigD
MFDAVCKVGLEGMVSKKIDSTYRSGRTKSWIKVERASSDSGN